MLKMKEYSRPATLEEAYQLAIQKNNVVLGGMLWLKMQNRTVKTAIDLSGLGLDEIKLEDDGWHIGAMVSLRDLETHGGLAAATQGAMEEAVKHIVGVQFRNTATVGGSIYGRFGFSDVFTLFLALGARVKLYRSGTLTLADFAKMPRKEKDLLTEIILPTGLEAAVYLSQRNTKTDFPTLACGIAKRDGKYFVSVGARPHLAVEIADENCILSGGITPDSAQAMAEFVAERVAFGSNLRGSGGYRRQLCRVLVRRGLTRMEEMTHGN